MREPPPMIDVDARGFDADGVDFNCEASPQALRDGLVTTRIVRLRYPDGQVRLCNEIRITEKGLSRMRMSGLGA